MAGLDKEETITGITAARDVFLRFGSTRLLCLAMALGFLAYLAWLDRSNALAYAAAGLLAAGATGVSLHLKPHIDRAPA